MADKYEPRKSPNTYHIESLEKYGTTQTYSQMMAERSILDIQAHMQERAIREMIEGLVKQWLEMTPEERKHKAWSLPKLEERELGEFVELRLTSHLLQYSPVQKAWMEVK